MARKIFFSGLQRDSNPWPLRTQTSAKRANRLHSRDVIYITEQFKNVDSRSSLVYIHSFNLKL